MLAIIGPDWLTAERDGKRRLDDPDDWVRREIAIALDLSRVSVIPVLVGDAELPTSEQLPEPLRALPGRQAITVRPDRFEDDVDNLIEHIGGRRRRWHGFPLWTWLAAAGMLIAVVTVAFVIRSNRAPVFDMPGAVTAVGGTPVEIDLLPWIDDEDKSTLKFSFDSESKHIGSVLESDGGVVTYVGPPRYKGSDSFQFTITDDHGEVTPGTVKVDVTLGSIGGLFNVAVAEFAGTGQAPAAAVSESLYQQIVAALGDTGIEVEVAGPTEVGIIAGDTPENRAEAAARLAEQTSADVVVYGALDTDEAGSSIAAEFYLSGRSLGDVEELVGTYELGAKELGATAPAALSSRANQILAPKVEALTKLALGLSHYQLQEYEEAKDLFVDAALDWPGSGNDTNGQEVVFHLLGNVNGLLGDLEEAESSYERALGLNPDYSRAQFGMAEVKYQRSRGPNCAGEGPVDIAGLQGAIDDFEEVAAMDAPELAFLPERSQIEIARIDLCLSSYGAGGQAEALSVLEAVLPGLEADSRTRDLAAEAHATLGGYYMSIGENQRAASEFETAVDSTLDTLRLRRFYISLDLIYRCRLHIDDMADRYLQEAQSLPGVPVKAAICPPP